MDRYDLLTVREANGKTYFTKIGAMFENKRGDGFNLVFEALPMPGSDGCRVLAKRPQERDGGGQRQPQDRGRAAPQHNTDLDDDVPF